MNDSLYMKRLHYRSAHRGNKEMDIVFGRFTEKGLERLPPATLAVFEQLLDENDVDIWNWLTGQETPAKYSEILALLLEEADKETSLRGGNACEAIQ